MSNLQSQIYGMAFNPRMPDRDETRKLAELGGYKMYHFNGMIRSVSDDKELFPVTSVVGDQEKFIRESMGL